MQLSKAGLQVQKQTPADGPENGSFPNLRNWFFERLPTMHCRGNDPTD
jgi:hypothetical protein